MTDNKLIEQQYKDSSKFNARIYINAKFSVNKYPWPFWIFDQIEKPDNAKVLEIGCGNGMLWWANKKRIPINWDIIVSDFSEGMINDAKKSLADMYIPLKFEIIDAEKIPYPDNTFDILIANHMLYHIPNITKGLSEIKRVLKPDGVLYASTVGANNMKEMRTLIEDFDPNSAYRNTASDITKNFSMENGEKILKNFFKAVTLKVYNDSLAITEAEPLVNYYLSCNDLVPGNIALKAEQAEPFREYLNNILKTDKVISVSKDSGIFVAHNKNT